MQPLARPFEFQPLDPLKAHPLTLRIRPQSDAPHHSIEQPYATPLVEFHEGLPTVKGHIRVLRSV